MATAPSAALTSCVHRIEVRPAAGMADPTGNRVRHDAGALGVHPSAVTTARVYLVEGSLSKADVDRIIEGLLTDPVTERGVTGAARGDGSVQTVEVHPLPGVMDPVAQSVRDAIRELIGVEVRVSTGWRYDFSGVSAAEADRVVRRLLANPVVHAIYSAPHSPVALPRGHEYALAIRRVGLRELDDAALDRLSREAHLFLDTAEMRAIRDHYRSLERDPTEIELETLAQTWSEHCVHKTLKSTIRYQGVPAASGGERTDPIRWEGRPGHTINPDGSVLIRNLLRSTVAAATHELIDDGVDWCLSVFVDNAGIIAFDEDHAVCVKVETHNHPSAIEPYGGAATGIGGCIRDIIGTGLGARPIASTDVFCVAFPEQWGEVASAAPGSLALPAGCLHPRRVLTDIVGGVRDYGNRMGIPTVSGAVWFDNRHVGNPLVFCGCVGLMPRWAIGGAARTGDRIIALGGRTGRDGIHGATFSSAELTDTHADEFAHAVQIGNAIEEKRVLDVVLRARDGQIEGRRGSQGGGPSPSEAESRSLFSAITDCGAGGFSSAVGEMGAELGATVNLDRAPLKYDGLSPTEIWISEAQERMVLAVPPANLPALARICREEGVEMADLGEFGTPTRELILTYHGTEVGRLSMEFLHDGIPTPTREARWEVARPRGPRAAVGTASASVAGPTVDTGAALLGLLSHPNIASKHWIIRQYDHEVQGRTVVKPLVGPGAGPSDASVIEPVPGTGRGLVISQGLATGYMVDRGAPIAAGSGSAEGDPYLMTLAAIDECVRNLVCVGADPSRIAILDNFCWPSCKRPENLGSLVRAAEACYDGAKAYRTPFVSGKDSLNNQFTTEDGRTIEIPPTLLITGIGIVLSLSRVVTMDAKASGNLLLLVGKTQPALAGSHLGRLHGERAPAGEAFGVFPETDLAAGPRLAGAVHALIAGGLVAAAHDVSDGGLLCAVAEMLIAAHPPESQSPGLGADLLGPEGSLDPLCWAFGESASRYVLEIEARHLDAARRLLSGLPCEIIGEITPSGRLTWPGAGVDLPVGELRDAWTRTLDW